MLLDKLKFLKADGTKNMTVGSPYKLKISFAQPIFLSQTFQQLYNTADTFIVGRALGTEALAAVSSSGTLIFFLTSFFMGTSMGGGVVIARYFGMGNKEKVKKAIHTSIAMNLICGVALTAVGVGLTPYLLRLMNTDPKVLPQAIEYFRCYFGGVLCMIIYNTCTGILNSLGDSKRPLYYLIFSSVLNVAMDGICIGIFKMGVGFSALSTVIAQGVSALLCLKHLMKKGEVYTVELKQIRIDKACFEEIVRYGLPSGIQNSVIALANVVVQSNINSFGEFATAAYGVHAKIEGFAFLPITSFNMATTTFISQNLGAGEYDRSKKASRFGIISAVLAAELVGVLCYIFAPYLISLFDSTPEVVQYGVTQARTVTLFYFLLAASHAVAAVCRGAGKAFVPMAVMLGTWCGIRIIYITTVMQFTDNIRYIYMAYPITWTISTIIYLCYYFFSDWVHGFEKYDIS